MPETSRLYVFEGPDGVGKSELSRRFAEYLAQSGVRCKHLSFPGREEGTLGKHVYELHHDAPRFGVASLSPTSLQLLHVAAHIDSIERQIRPALEMGYTIVLDRFWWSTKVYGLAAGMSPQTLDTLIGIGLTAWGNIHPTAVFLIARDEPLRPEPMEHWQRHRQLYDALAHEEARKCSVYLITNNSSIDNALDDLIASYQRTLSSPGSNELQLSLDFNRSDIPTTLPYTFSSLSPARPSPVFDTYWRFATERQAIFFRRFAGLPMPWTSDPILVEYKFTNAYRASDRVSQFLIRHVIYEGDQAPAELFFRILLFKLFNKIETWQLLREKFGEVRYTDYCYEHYDRVLSEVINRGDTIYSAAYIMPSGSTAFGTTRKHRAHLRLLERMMEDEVPYRIAEARSMYEGFTLLRSYPMIGDFLAYQYITDLNYSPLTNFSETEFVVPGPGARSGIHKCFESLGGLNEIDIIKVVTDRQQLEFDRLGLEFQSLWGRPLQLIDCQNLFCEVDKYARIKHPEVIGISQRTRIKQKLRPDPQPILYWYPPKWALNDVVARSCHASPARSDVLLQSKEEIRDGV